MDGLKMKYFVLKPKSKYQGDMYAYASRCAMREYADRIYKTNPKLSDELRAWAYSESEKEAELAWPPTK